MIGTTSTDEKAAFLRDLGVNHIIDNTSEAFNSRIWAFDGPLHGIPMAIKDLLGHKRGFDICMARNRSRTT